MFPELRFIIQLKVPLMLGLMLLKASAPCLICKLGTDGNAELVQSEDRFTDVKDALKNLNKMDFDKLVASVRISSKLLSASLSNTTLYMIVGRIRSTRNYHKQICLCSCISDAQPP